MKAVLIVLVVLVIGAIGYTFLKSKPPSMNPMQTSAPADVNNVPANSVIIQGNAFTPDTLNVKTGTKVTWTNNDSYTHTVTSKEGMFDSGNVNAGGTFSFTFTKAGTYNYYCAIHTFMNAKVVVTN